MKTGTQPSPLLSESARGRWGLRRIFKSAVAWGFLAAFLRAGSSLIILPLLVHRVSSEELGVWYLFGAIAGALGVLDIGFSTNVARAAACAWAGAPRLLPFGLAGLGSTPAEFSPPNRPLLAQLAASMDIFYRRAALAGALLLLVCAGPGIWTKTSILPHATALRAALPAFLLATGVNVWANLWLALLSAIHQVHRVQHLFIVGLVCNYSVCCASLLANLGIWSMVLGNLSMGLALAILGRRDFFARSGIQHVPSTPAARMEILRTIWPNAWRAGVLHVATYLILSGNVLMSGIFLSLRETGSYGLTFQIVMMIVQVSGVWMQVKLPVFNQLRAQGRLEELALVFTARLRLCLGTYLLGGCGLLLLGPFALSLIGSKTPLLPLPMLSVLLIFVLLQMNHSQYEALVLTENRNPFMVPYLTSGVIIVALGLCLIPTLGLWGLLLSATLVQACYNNWWPILRAIQGLNYSPARYFRLFFFNKNAL